MSDGVVLSWIFPGLVDGNFAYSVANLLRHDAQGAGHVTGTRGGIITLQTGPRVAEARNILIDNFAEQHPQAEWLLMIDSDMTFEPDLVDRMMQVASKHEVPVLGALCFVPQGDTAGPRPTVYREVIGQDGVVDVQYEYDYPRDTLCKVGGTGAAGLLIHRNVLARMIQPWPQGFGTLQDGTPNPFPWFVEGLVGPKGRQYGEDIAFCRRLSQLGIPIHVHTGIKMGHIKRYELNEDYYLEHRANAEQAVQAKTNGNRAQRRAKAKAAR